MCGVRDGTVEHSTARHGTARHGTARHANDFGPKGRTFFVDVGKKYRYTYTYILKSGEGLITVPNSACGHIFSRVSSHLAQKAGSQANVVTSFQTMYFLNGICVMVILSSYAIIGQYKHTTQCNVL